MDPISGYCVKCKEKREIKDAVEVAMPAKGGKTRPAVKGVCPVCGCGIFKIVAKDWKKDSEAPVAPAPETPPAA